MAPITDNTVDALKDLVNRLEARVEQLEAKLHEAQGGSPKTQTSDKSLRMVLMGPPGAGTRCDSS